MTEAPGSARRRHRAPQWLSILGRAARTPRGIVGLAITGLIVLIAGIGPFVAPYSASALPTFEGSTPSGTDLLGGDYIGHDVLSRVLAGGWVLLIMAALATAIAVVVGAAAGVSAAYLRGKADGIIMRTVDVILAFPQLVFALLLVSLIGPKLWLIVLAVGFSQAPPVARVLRSATLDVSERDYVKAVELQGVKSSKVMRGEILPNLVSPLMVETGLRITFSIVIMAGLAYLGFSQPPPAPNWGFMIFQDQLLLSTNPWSVLVPVILIALLTIGTNTFTDAIARVAIGVERPEEAIMVDEIVMAKAV